MHGRLKSPAFLPPALAEEVIFLVVSACVCVCLSVYMTVDTYFCPVDTNPMKKNSCKNLKGEHPFVATVATLLTVDREELFVTTRAETGPARNWLKCAETSCNCSICMAVPK